MTGFEVFFVYPHPEFATKAGAFTPEPEDWRYQSTLTRKSLLDQKLKHFCSNLHQPSDF